LLTEPGLGHAVSGVLPLSKNEYLRSTFDCVVSTLHFWSKLNFKDYIIACVEHTRVNIAYCVPIFACSKQNHNPQSNPPRLPLHPN